MPKAVGWTVGKIGKQIRPGFCLQESETIQGATGETCTYMALMWAAQNQGHEKKDQVLWEFRGSLASNSYGQGMLSPQRRRHLSWALSHESDFRRHRWGDEALQADGMAWARTEVEKYREQTVIQFGWTMVYDRGWWCLGVKVSWG